MAMFRVSNSSPLALIRKAEGDNADSDPKVENDIDPPKKKFKVEEDEEYSTDFGTTPKSYFDEAKSGSEKPNPVFVEREQFNFNYSGLEEEYITDFGTNPKSYFDEAKSGSESPKSYFDEAKSGSESPNPVFVEREQFNFNYSGLEEEYSTDFGTNPKSYFDEAKSGSESPKSYFDEAKSGSESPNPVFVEREQLKFDYSGLEREQMITIVLIYNEPSKLPLSSH